MNLPDRLSADKLESRVKELTAELEKANKSLRAEILERKSAEKALHESEDRYRFLYEHSLDEILLTKPDGTILSANPQACQMFGMTEDEIIRVGRDGTVVKDEKLAAAVEERERTCQMRAELTYRRKDGSTFIGEVTSNLFTDAYGGIKTSMVVRDVTGRKQAEEALHQCEQRMKLKLDAILSPSEEVDNLELAEIIDTQAIQSLMEDFYKLAHIPIGIIDIKGNVLVGVGWQDICTRFHRANPETCKHCVESDTKLSAGIPPGKYKPYKCKNNMWDVGTPIFVGDRHAGNIFLGQFFFDGELLDYELFRSQAKRYGFNEEEYIAALEKAPRLSPEAVDTIMTFFMKLANMLSQQGYSNIKLAHSLAERDILVEALRESEKLERARSDELAVVLDAAPVTVFISHDPEALKITGNRLSYEWLRLPEGANMSKAAPEGERHETYRLFKDGVEIPLSDMPVRMAASGKEVRDYEFDIVYPDGTKRHLLGNAKPLRDEQGNPHGSISAFIDITERKRAEEEVQSARNMLQLIMNNIPQGIFWKDRNSRYMGCNKVFAKATGVESPENIVGKTDYDLPWLPEQTEWFREYDRRTMENDTPEYHIVERQREADGELAWIETNKVPLHDAKGNVIGILGTYENITERKRAEEALRLSNLYNRSLIEASLDPLVTIGRDGKVIDVNGATEEVTGYSRDDLIGMDFSDYFTEPEKARAGYQRVFSDGEVRDYPLEIQHKDGHITPVLYNASVYRGESGEVIGVFAAARDITERKKAEEALKKVLDDLEKLVKERTEQLEKAYNSLKESEKGLAEAQRMAHIGNWRWNIVTNELFWSDEVYNIFGLNPQEFKVTYDSFLNYVHPDDRDYLINAINEGLNGRPCGVDYRIIIADGEERIVHTESEVIFFEENIPIQAKGIIQDITERKKAEERIQTLVNVVESSDDAIVTESLEGIVISWNKGAEQVYGYSAEEILGKNITIVEPDNLKGEIKRYSEKIKQKGKSQHYETLRLKKDGTIINISATLSPVFNASRELVAISCIARDITERIKAEEKIQILANAVESSSDAIVTRSLDDVIIGWNKGAEQIHGYSAEEILGKHISILEPDSLRGETTRFSEMIKQGKTIQQYETSRLRKDGTIIIVSLTLSPVFNASGELVAISAIARDITERIKAEKALAEIEKVRIKEIHHRIKNNLQVISSLLDLQAEKFQNKECIEAFRESQNRVLSMSLIHEELYKGRGTDTLDFSAYLQKLAENLFKTYSLQSDNIRLHMDLEENAFFDMDTAIPLSIIVNELVSNSLKHAFTENQEGEIRIRLCREEENSETHESLFSVTISDNGKGILGNIELENLESLGLQLVSTLVDQLDGEIEIKRENGTEFRITFSAAERLQVI